MVRLFRRGLGGRHGYRLHLSAAGLALILAPLGVAREAPVPFRYVPQKLTKADLPRVAALYQRTCSACHGKAGEGAGNGLSLYGSKDPRESAVPIHFGRSQPPPQTIVMPAYGAQKLLTQAEIAQLAEYIATFRPPWP